MSKNLALVRVLGDDRLDTNTRDINIGLGYLASSAESIGIEVDLHDPIDSSGKSLSFYANILSSYTVVGFTLHCLNVSHTLSLIKEIKKENEDVLIVLGGHHASATATELMDDYMEIDVVCIGDSELSIQEVCLSPEKYHRRGHKPGTSLYGGSVPDLNSLPLPSRKNIAVIERVLTSRGCPYRCTFCTTPATIKLAKEPIYRVRDIHSVIDEISFLNENGTKHIYLNDDLFVVNNSASQNRAKELAESLISLNLNLTLKAQLRVDSFLGEDRSILELLRKAGLKEVFIGLESGSSNTLHEYQKDVTKQQNIDSINFYNSIDIKINAGNIPAAPNTALDDLKETIEMFSQLKLAFLLFRRVTFRALVFPGTTLEKSLIATNRLKQTKRYFLGSYDFLDSRISRLTTALEDRMPYFLQEVGGELFSLRNSCARVKDNWSTEKLLIFDSVMDDWSKSSEETITKIISFISSNLDTPEKIDTIMTHYIELCVYFRKILIDLLGNNTNNLMAGDLF
jgi:radical SAM superfamily enzyme YgiQ (UPF0313 family)